eukprot:6163053-Heterocapsa_arctica.AAC.1
MDEPQRARPSASHVVEKALTFCCVEDRATLIEKLTSSLGRRGDIHAGLLQRLRGNIPAPVLVQADRLLIRTP